MNNIKTEKPVQGAPAPRGRRVSDKKKNRNSAKVTVLVILALLLVVTAVVAVVLAWAINSYEGVYPNITFTGEDIGGMTDVQAKQTIDAIMATYADEAVEVKFGDVSKVISTIDAGAAITGTVALSKAMEIGRTGTAMNRVSEVISTFFNGKEIIATSDINRESIEEFLEEFATVINRDKIESAYSIGKESVEVQVGVSGRTLDLEKAVAAIVSGLQSNGTKVVLLEESTVYDLPKKMNLLDVYNEIYVKEMDAHLDGRSKEFEIVPETIGVRFDLNSANKKVEEAGNNGGSVEIPIIYTTPEVTMATFEEQLFRDVLSEAKTTLNAANLKRTGNVRLSADAINGLILNPGDVFSFNEVVGRRTYERGYKDASVYVSDGIEDQLGGGICQTSSTVYMNVIRAGLEITERYNHSYTVAYAPLGEDATVYWGSLDFKFSNNLTMPIKIEAYQKSNYVVVRILGTKFDENTTKIETNVLSHTPYSTSTIDDPTLEFGKTKQKVEGHGAYKVESFRVIYDKDGNVVEKVKLPNSRYRLLNRVLLRGTKNAPTATPAPTVESVTEPPVSQSPAPEEPSVSPTPTQEPTPTPIAPSPTPEEPPEGEGE